MHGKLGVEENQVWNIWNWLDHYVPNTHLIKEEEIWMEKVKP